jgi:hypothetical protein
MSRQVILLKAVVILSLQMSPAASQDNASVEFIDGNRLLMTQLGIPTGAFSRNSDCLPLGGGSGMRAKKVPCEFYYVLKDVEVARVEKIQIDLPDGKDIPTFIESQTLEFENCLSSPYPYNETVKYTSTDEVSMTFTRSLENVKEFESTLDVSSAWKFMDLSSKTTETSKLTWKTGSEIHSSKESHYEVEKTLKFDIPARTTYLMSFSDTKKRIQIPVHLTVTLRANQYREIRALNGRVAESTLVKKLDDLDTIPQRTVTIDALLVVKGGDRQLKVKLAEKPCSE